MKRQNDFKLVVELFKHYYQEINNQRFIFQFSDRNKKLVENFLSEFKKITNSKFIQKEFLKLYFEFQFHYWRNRNTKYGSKGIRIEWILGKKAIKRWQEAKSDEVEWIGKQSLSDDVKSYSFKKKEIKDLVIELNRVEEKEKQRFFNKRKGFFYCQIAATLYNHKSEFCMQCKFKKDCKKLLKKELPNVFKTRGY